MPNVKSTLHERVDGTNKKGTPKNNMGVGSILKKHDQGPKILTWTTQYQTDGVYLRIA
ncbi:hypothetical protein DPMN_021429 [Dreissena polymorpha]|uniref:Uncharacterized protein n=1 Tax=Dreissena polymorpha TaxID=45954 RepID=A0A9D4NIJ6_DREPO|nr:hypothetical protein DPMN_021429 [Dreissena polymorpha]